MRKKTKRLFLASIAPAALQLLTVAAVTLYSGDQASGDQSLGFILVLLVCVTLSTIILGRDSFDRFWKVHVFSCAVSALPIALLTAGIAIFNGSQGYFWLGLTVMTLLIIIAALLSLPVTYLAYTYAITPPVDR